MRKKENKFIRTYSGLRNQKRFYRGVDCLVYVEGGKQTLTIAEIDNGNENEKSLDSFFWEQIFKTCNESLKVRIKAVGSKSALLKISERVNGKSDTYTAMDREFDLIDNALEQNKLYTFGYSWENDAWHSKTIKAVIEDIAIEEIPMDQVEEVYNNFINDISDFVKIDKYYFNDGGIFPRESIGKCIHCNINEEPYIKVEVLNELLQELNIPSKLKIKIVSEEIAIHNSCYGHLIGKFCMHFIRHFMKVTLKLSGIDFEYLSRSCIKQFTSYWNKEISNFYINQINYVTESI